MAGNSHIMQAMMDIVAAKAEIRGADALGLVRANAGR